MRGKRDRRLLSSEGESVIDLTSEQIRLLDLAEGSPVWLPNGDEEPAVLLSQADFLWIREQDEGIPELPRRVDARTGSLYVLIPLRFYERYRALSEDDP